MALTPEQALQEQIRLQTEFNRLQEESKRLANEVSSAGNAATQAQRDALAVAERVEKEGKKALDTAKRRTKEFETVEKKSLGAFRSFARLSSEVQSNLGTLTNASNSYIDIQREIIKLEEQQAGLDEVGIEAAEARAAFLSEISQSQLSQAQATAKAMEDAKGINEFESKRLEIQQNSLGLSDQQKQMALDALDATEASFKKEQRILSIKESQQGLYEAIPESMRGGIDFAKKLGDTLKNAGKGAVAFMVLATVITAAVASFTALDTAASEFRKETGLTNSQTKEIKSNVNEIVGEFGSLGIEAKDVFDTVSALKSEFGDIYNTSKETTAALTVLSTNFGVAAKDAAKVQGVYERMGGVSSETAANLQLQAAEMAKMAGVAPAKVAEDIAEAAEESYKFFKGDVTELTKAAIQARRLGTNLKDVLEVNRKLLDFEGGIEDELVAATFAGGQFNLTQARTLAASGKQIEAQEEILKQIQRSGDFRKQDLFTQEALAKGAGMEVGEIIKQLDAQEKLASLSEDEREKAKEAIEKGLDITNINADQLAQETEKFAKQQEQQATLERISNAFTGIASTVGTVLMPLIEGFGAVLEFVLTPVTAIAKGMADFVNYVKESLPLMAALTAGAATYLFLKNKALLTTQAEAAWELAKIGYQTTLNGIVAAGNLIKKQGLLGAIAEMAMSAFSSVAKIPFIGPVLAVAAAAGALALGYQYYSKAGDVMSPADGKTRISTKEGGLFELSPNDDLVAAPGAAAALANQNKTQSLNVQSIGSPTETLNGSNTSLEPITSMETVTESGIDTNAENLTKSQGDISILSEPLQAMINELKALREDLRSGKIGVYMDGTAVSSKISKVVDRIGVNSYS
jgi:hypothetical protein